MAKYRNTKTGLVAEVPDEAPTRQLRLGRDKQWSQKLSRMARSKRWEKVPDSTKVGKGPKPGGARKATKAAKAAPADQQGQQEQGEG